MDATEAFNAAKAGDRRSMARLLTLIESGEANGAELGFSSRGEDCRILGVTGSPGVGKSCLVDRLLHAWAAAGEKVAVLAIDPSSPVTGGALLGDRMRMQAADDLDEVYVRSVATRNQPGGLPVRLAAMAEALLDCGYDRVVVETVGTGQAEVRIVAVADRVLLVEGPARGDSIQAEKAGLLELADIVAVNKADLDGADRFAESQGPVGRFVLRGQCGSRLCAIRTTIGSVWPLYPERPVVSDPDVSTLTSGSAWYKH